ncbi:unnamed protein product [Rhodiola kirilowii]
MFSMKCRRYLEIMWTRRVHRTSEKLRFDFSHGKPVEAEHLSKIESIVNEQIKAELDVYAKEATLAEAKQINGLRAVFGEVYPDPVRVVISW